MNLKSKRKKISEFFSTIGALLFVIVLGGFGLMMLHHSGVFNVRDVDMLYECVFKDGDSLIFGIFLFLVSLYLFVFILSDLFLPPKKEIFYLKEFDDDSAIFLSKKGKKFYYKIDQKKLKEKSYYYVLKKQEYITEVLESTKETWIPKEKKSYWMNYYSPAGNLEDCFLLPIVYVILLPGILSIIMSEGSQKIYGIIYSIVPFYMIMYDLIYKIKLKKSNGKEIDETYFIKFYEILVSSIIIIIISVMCIMIVTVFLKLSDLTSKLIILPFVGCALCTLGLNISKIFENQQWEKIFYKGYVIIFLIYLFGFLLFWTIGIIKQEGNYSYILFSIPFWIAGFFILYKYIIKK